MQKLLKYRKAIDIARNGVALFALIDILHHNDNWLSLLGNYTIVLDKELLFLKKIADAD